MIAIEVNDSQVQAAFDKLLAASADMEPFYQQLGERLLKSTKDRFAKGKDPDGNAWAKNTALTLSRKKGSAPLIGETKSLSNEIHYALLYDGVLIGSSKEYAAMQQFGGITSPRSMFPNKAIPSRPFLGISDEDRDAIAKLAALHLLGK